MSRSSEGRGEQSLDIDRMGERGAVLDLEEMRSPPSLLGGP